MKIVIVGGSGGLGTHVTNHFKRDYNRTYSLSSKDLDIRDRKACAEFFAQVEPEIVINMSGVNHDKFIHKLGQEDEYKINHLLDVNLHGSVNIASTCLPGMRERGYGVLIYMSSILSTKTVLGTALYSSCKAFLDRFVIATSAENAGKGIRVNSIQLGYFEGGLTDRIDPISIQKIKSEIPVKRLGRGQELCDTLDYLIYNEYITGVNLPVNGGLL